MMNENFIEKTLDFISVNGYNNSKIKFLKETSKFLSKLVGVDHILIDKYSINEPNNTSTVVFYKEGNFKNNISYNLENTPCNNIIKNNNICLYTENVQKLFPKDKFLIEGNINSYIGIPLLSSKREPIGLIALMDTKPFENIKAIENVLKIIAIKVEKVLENILFEEISKESELEFKELSNLTFEGIIIHELGIAQDVNTAFEKMFGYHKNELIGKNIIELLFQKKHYDFIIEKSKNGYTLPYELEGVKKDGSLFPVEIEGRNINLENSKKRVAAVRDLSDRRKIEIENNKFSTVVEQSGNTIVITNLEGEIEYTNPKFTELTGYSAEEAKGKNPNILSSGNQPKEYYQEMWETISNGSIWKGEFQNKAKNGTLFWENVTITPIKNNNGEIINYLAIKEDITARKESEAALKDAYYTIKEKENYLRNILKTANEGFWIVGKNHFSLEVNKKMCAILGCSESEIVGKSIFNFVDEENSEIFKNQIKQRELGLSTSYEAELLQPNGNTVKCLFNTSPLYDKDNNRVGSFALVTDISNINLAYKKLEAKNKEILKVSNELSEKNRLHLESKDKYRNLFENSPVSLWEIDYFEAIEYIKSQNIAVGDLEKYFDHNVDFLKECISKIIIEKVNKNTLALFGVSTVEELRKILREKNKESLFKSVKNELLGIFSHKKINNIEIDFRNLNNEIISAIIKSEIYKNGKGIISVIDITALKKAEIQLNKEKNKAEKSDERYRLAVRATGLGIWDWDLVLDKVYFSNYYKQQIGYKSNELENSFDTWKNLVHPDDIEGELLKIEKYKKNPKGQYISEFRFQHKNGSYIWILSRAEVLINEKGKVVRMFGSHRNITVRKKALAELKEQTLELVSAKEKAEESNRLKTEFLNNMSHEIRTPMNGILGFSELLGNPELSEAKKNYFINIIKNSGNQLLHVIDDIIEISRLGTKQVKVVEKPVCLNDVLLELFSVFDIKAKENKVPLYIKKSLSDQESTIFTDKSKINKIISNLLENALKYTNKGHISFGYDLKNKELEIYVKDTGIGINEDKQEIIFERFSQEEKNLSQSVGGLGLGLSIAKENTELLGGKISVISKKGHGSIFRVKLPYKPVIEISDINNETEIIKEKSTKDIVLIVEDEEINYLFLEILILEKIKINCEILHAQNGKEAIEYCKNNSEINFVLMDINMPVMNGYEAAKLIREFRPNLPIIAQTAYSTREDKEKALEAGCNDFISKPINIEELKTILTKYLTPSTVN